MFPWVPIVGYRSGVGVMDFYCSFCDFQTEDAAAAQGHVEAVHAGAAAWFCDQVGALAPALSLGAAVWYWRQESDRSKDAWTRATVTSWGAKDGAPVLDVVMADGGVRWGWLWQVLPGSEPMPTRRPAALDGAAGPWP